MDGAWPGICSNDLFSSQMIRLNLLRRPLLRSRRIVQQNRRFASSYDVDVAGLTEEEAEVIRFLSTSLRYTHKLHLVSKCSLSICGEGSGPKSSRD